MYTWRAGTSVCFPPGTRNATGGRPFRPRGGGRGHRPVEARMSATMPGDRMRTEAWDPRRRAPAGGDVRRTDVNRIRNTVPELATPVWAKRLAVGLGYFSVGLG